MFHTCDHDRDVVSILCLQALGLKYMQAAATLFDTFDKEK